MHDTLANRGRVKYDAYSPEEQNNIKTITSQYLAGEMEDIENIDSLRMIREIFGQIKTEYKKCNQHIDSLKRQMKENPEKFKQTLEKQKEEEAKAEEAEKKAAEEAEKKAAEEKAAEEGAEGEEGEAEK